MRSALLVIVLASCSRSSPPEPTTSVPTKSAPVAVSIPSPVVVDAPSPVDAPTIDAANLVATCGIGWRSVTTSLTRVAADEQTVTLCSSSSWMDNAPPLKMHNSPERCARLDLATGTFAEHPATPATAAAPAVIVDGVKICRGTSCVALDVSADDAAALAESELPPDLDPAGAHAVVVLPIEKAVGVFDTATGKRIRTLAVASGKAGCPADAFFIGDVIYASARGCDDLDFEQSKAWLFAGAKKTAIKPLAFARDNRLQLAGDLWAVQSLKPYRVDFIHGTTGAVTWSVPLPGNEYDPMKGACCLALGVTAMGTLVHDVPPLARVGSTAAIVAVAPRTITWIDPVAKKTKVSRFPPCPP